MRYGIEFNGKHSYKDLGITIADKDIGFPDKEKILIKVPFSNMEYDFSEIYGSQTYTSRPLSYSFNVLDKQGLNTKERMNITKTILVNWLMNSSGKQKLYDDTFLGYYFLAEVENGVSFEEKRTTGILKVNFNAYPFMIAEQPEGNDIWDNFNFELDLAQEVEFVIDGTIQVTLINSGTPNVSPTIQSTSPMIILKDGLTYNVPSGTSKSLDFVFKSGENYLTITGNGTISFKFYKELI